jgi:hypothetical protein
MTTTTEHSTDLAETLAQSALLIKSRVAEAEKLSKLALADAEWLVLEIEKLIENGAPLQALFAAQDLAGMIVGVSTGQEGLSLAHSFRSPVKTQENWSVFSNSLALS